MDLRTQFEKETGHNRAGIELAATETSAYIRWLESQYQSQSARIRELEGVIEGLLEQHNIRLDLDVSGELPGWAITRCEKALNKKEQSDGSVIRG